MYPAVLRHNNDPDRQSAGTRVTRPHRYKQPIHATPMQIQANISTRHCPSTPASRMAWHDLAHTPGQERHTTVELSNHVNQTYHSGARAARAYPLARSTAWMRPKWSHHLQPTPNAASLDARAHVALSSLCVLTPSRTARTHPTRLPSPPQVPLPRT